jgi:hypothetical protein
MRPNKAATLSLAPFFSSLSLSLSLSSLRKTNILLTKSLLQVVSATAARHRNNKSKAKRSKLQAKEE